MLPCHACAGDGTILWTCHLFGNRAVPPLVPFNLGSLGFLTPFQPEEIEPMLHLVIAGEEGTAHVADPASCAMSRAATARRMPGLQQA